MMNLTEKEFLEELRRDFILEAEEYLQTITAGLLDLERPDSPPRVLEEVFRAAHSLKGAAQAVRMPAISGLCQVLESVFSAMKKGVLHPSTEGFDILQRSVDVLSAMVSAGGEDDGRGTEARKVLETVLSDEGSPGSLFPPFIPHRQETAGIRAETAEEKALPQIPPPASGEQGREGPEQPAGRGTPRETVRIGADKLDGLLLRAEEMISLNQVLDVRLGEIRELRHLLAEWLAEWRRTENVLKKTGEDKRLPPRAAEFFTAGRNRLREAWEQAAFMERSLADNGRTSGILVEDLLEEARSVLMLPFSSLLQGFPKIVRDLARDLLKDVEFSAEGGDVEVDKRILEGLKDPLVHLVRNALDHGIERPEERRAGGKPEKGRLSIAVSSVERGRVEITLSDDGKGIDPERLRASAMKSGLLEAEEVRALTDEEALMLIFQSGLSTSPIITDISGRGLGMAIVREGVESLGGKISLSSLPEKGTRFTLSLPVTLATFRGVIVREWGQQFVIPTACVRRAARVRRSDIRTVENRETVSLDGMPHALVRLGSLLGMAEPADRTEKDVLPVVAAGTGDSIVAFVVDGVLNEQEVLLKPLGGILKRVRNVGGVTVLGSGKVVPVLHCGDLVKSALKGTVRSLSAQGEAGEAPPAVLVAEDSITSRALLKNILTAAGYAVHTAADGQEAWKTLSRGEISLVVSDVEMPGMNGFELTSKIRSEERLSDLPVILVTSLESAEDRERGVVAGADAYIVKSGFDQGALLDVIRRLL
ncbi:two-component system chemotaxis sensor kinase CheA [Aminivibrio pyruvatiphilus]|uniref:histidine kinase n=1 Tax=Aminivibrio pyruvatiphilus TaxID=1005740 RepID=A0A4R8M3A9_9BACT|nr:hybrid sensor histidine kinase/response regulator [Aminivibrio pyruvatiphilus]TDY59474.1 two-component system chemotaxis sensor kinase CheA [Aminivibrio pyruvatiphilus]